MKNKKKKRGLPAGRQGSAILLSMILLFVVLALVASLSYVTILEQKMSGKTKSSVGAFYNSESGVEWALNKIATSTATDVSGTFGTSNPGSGVQPSGVSDYKVYLLDENGNVITSNLSIDQVKAVRSVGSQGQETQRAIEAAVAAGVGGITGGCSMGSNSTTILAQWGNGCKSNGSSVNGNNWCSDANISGYVCGPSGWVPANQVFCVCVKN